jgi:putative PIN family toxin of toxin-antitoxin system
MSALRVVLDTNVIVSGLARPVSKPGLILEACSQGGVALVLSRYILEETLRVLPKVAKGGMTAAKIRDLVESVQLLAEIVEPSTEIEPLLRDEADQLVLGTLRAARADYLITGDKDLLALAGSYPIVTPAAFWERHGS